MMLPESNGHPPSSSQIPAIEPPKTPRNGIPGDLVFVCFDPGLAVELRSCGFQAIDEPGESGALEQFTNRRDVIVAYRGRTGTATAMRLQAWIRCNSHPVRVGLLDMELDFHVDRPFPEWWLDQISEGQYDSGVDFKHAALERASWVEGEIAPPWPELTFEDVPPVPPFPTGVFPKGIENFLVGVSEVTNSPEDVAGCALLAVASAAIGRSVGVHLKRSWRESPQMYLVLIADPGRTKSPPQRLVVKPLTAIDAEMRKRSERDLRDWEDAKKDLKKGMPTPPRPMHQRAIVEDITKETLVAILADNPRGVLVDPDEATGWVGSFNQYKGKGTDRQFWLRIHNGDAISSDREGGKRSYYVSNPLATVFGGMTPDMIGTLSEEQDRNDGFIDRILFSFPDEFPPQEWYEDDLDPALVTIWDSVVRRLHGQAMAYDADRDQTRPWVVDFTPEAKRAWVAWFNRHCKEMDSPDAPAWVRGTYSKLRAYCARLVLILSRLRLALDPESDLSKDPVSLDDLNGAIELTDYFKSHVAKLHHRRTGGTGSREADYILAWIRRKGIAEFRERDVRKDLARRFPTTELLREGLAKLTQLGAIREVWLRLDPSKTGPKPTPMHEVNPALLNR